jgi:pimeloyl-ACP methyl ester carboxylesterase
LLTTPGCGGSPLQPWHTEKLTSEFTEAKYEDMSTFNKYRKLEDRLFHELEEKVYGKTGKGPDYILVRDMAAAVRMAMEHLAAKVGGKPIHIVGYSTGAALALDYSLDAAEGVRKPEPASLVLISPAIGIHPAAVLAGVKTWLSNIPGLGGLAWLDVMPEFDPYKYNSFATNAGDVVHRLTRSVSRRITAMSQSDLKIILPPILVFKSAIDATVSTDAVVDSLLKPLAPHRHELVLFDINRSTLKSRLLVSDPGLLSDRLSADDKLPFTLSLITNENPESPGVISIHRAPLSSETQGRPLDLVWPPGIISLSHVALPFPPDDPLYGLEPQEESNRVFLGQTAVNGERNLLSVPSDWMLRLRHNPFYDYLETRMIDWVDGSGTRKQDS